MIGPTVRSEISLRERRPCEGLDVTVPMILRGDALYDLDLDRFFLELPLDGVRSRHSLRSYAYDVVVWIRFLIEARGKTIWEAERDDVTAYHRARRRGDAGHRITAASWNRAIACLDRLYRWAKQEALVPEVPFGHRVVWQRGHGGRRGSLATRNNAYERAAKKSDVRFIALGDYRVFRDVGLRGLTNGGSERPGARDRNGTRNALFAELLVTTGLRLEEASFLLAFELDSLEQAKVEDGTRQVWFDLPAALTKGGRGRRIVIPRRLLREISAYLAVERAAATAKFKTRHGWRKIGQPLFIQQPKNAAKLRLCDGGTINAGVLTPDERGRLDICDAKGAPQESAVLWLTEVGQPVQPNTWEVAFSRASGRCTLSGAATDVSPHQLRHTFAVHMLAMLIRRQMELAALSAGNMDSYRQMLGDPLQQVQRLLGHASLATTYLYLDHVVSRADTIDAAVDELLGLLSNESRP
jgi:site-specific recombinase XerD